MSNRVVSIRNGLILLFAVTAMTSCGDTGNPVQNPSAGRTDKVDLQQNSQGTSERDALRIREDPLRNRLWVLTLEEVRIYDNAKKGKTLIRKIALPNWSVVGFRNVCMPDMVLDRAGSAFISSNAQARLLRIDANRFDLKDYPISFHERGAWDIGFGALAFSTDGNLLARTTPGGLLWKIDITKATAIMVEGNKKPLVDECAITTHTLNDLERSK